MATVGSNSVRNGPRERGGGGGGATPYDLYMESKLSGRGGPTSLELSDRYNTNPFVTEQRDRMMERRTVPVSPSSMFESGGGADMSQCSGWSPPSGMYQDMGGSCNRFGSGKDAG